MVEIVGTRDRIRQYFAKAWRLALVEGVLAGGAGLFLLFRPVGAIMFLIRIMGIYWLVSGIFKSIAALSGGKEELWWTRLAGGISLVALGALALAYPLFATRITSAVLTLAAASLATVGGVLTVVWGFSTAGIERGDGWTILSGLLSVVVGFVLFSAPFISMSGLDILVGVLALASGIGQVIFSLRMREASRIASRIRGK